LDNVSLRDIEAIAKLESAKMQHFYVGVEHLFIALTKLHGGLTHQVFEQEELSPRYLRYVTRELAGQGDKQRYWPGYRTTPRATAVMAQAQALIDDGVKPEERALLLAILDELESLPVRALQEAGVDMEKLRTSTQEWSGKARAQAPRLQIDGGEKLKVDEKHVLELLFQKYANIEIAHIFQEGFSGSTVMLVRPLHADGRSDALVVVKIADRQAILWEKKRYDSFVKDTLPPTTARIEAEPALPDRSPLGGLKYTFVRMRGGVPTNLHDYVQAHDAEEVARFLRDSLYNGFREAWWGQAKPYQFIAWQEYEFLLPPALVVQSMPADTVPKRTLRPLDEWSRNGSLHPGEIVELEAFTVQKVKRGVGIIQLTAGAAPEAINRASQIDMRGLDFKQKMPFRGEMIRKLIGQIVQTRDDILQEQVQALAPNFPILDETLPYGSNPSARLPNPLRRYARILDQRLSGTLSTIHGDLHMGNILIGTSGDAWLIDFEWTRDGHTLFDWAVLETSLLIEHVVLSVGEDWDSVWQAVKLLESLDRKFTLDDEAKSPLTQAFRPIAEIRSIVSELLASPRRWNEYHTALAMCSLRVIGWSNRPLAARRLAFLASAVAMDMVRDQSQVHTAGDLTDVTTDPYAP
jgi:hypothetical protein